MESQLKTIENETVENLYFLQNNSILTIDNKDAFLLENFLHEIEKIDIDEQNIDEQNEFIKKFYSTSINLSKVYQNLKLNDEALEVLEKAINRHLNKQTISVEELLYKSLTLKEKIELKYKHFNFSGLENDLYFLLNHSLYLFNIMNIKSEFLQNIMVFVFTHSIKYFFHQQNFKQAKECAMEFKTYKPFLNPKILEKFSYDIMIALGYEINCDILLQSENYDTILEKIMKHNDLVHYSIKKHLMLKNSVIKNSEEHFHLFYKKQYELESFVFQNKMFNLFLHVNKKKENAIVLLDEVIDYIFLYLKQDFLSDNDYFGNYFVSLKIIISIFKNSFEDKYDDYLKYIKDELHVVQKSKRLEKNCVDILEMLEK